MFARLVIPLCAVFCLAPFITSGTALLLGILIALAFGNPYLEHARKTTHRLLALSVVGLGFGMNLEVIGKVGFHGIGYTIIGIASSLVLGYLLGKFFKTDQNTSALIAVGTAICGGSAIAAVAPAIRAKSHEISVSLGVVFLLNSVALLIFPPLGHHLKLSQVQFGLWCALAIHDTSSVVGAALQYGSQALEVGTTVKLARALWIAPVAFGIGSIYSSRQSQENVGKIKKPWFILGFLVAAALVTWAPSIRPTGNIINLIAKRTLVVTLFLIGAGLTRETIRGVGLRPFLQGISLWILVGSGTLAAIVSGWIHQ